MDSSDVKNAETINRSEIETEFDSVFLHSPAPSNKLVA
jgi:hypothetical protein